MGCVFFLVSPNYESSPLTPLEPQNPSPYSFQVICPQKRVYSCKGVNGSAAVGCPVRTPHAIQQTPPIADRRLHLWMPSCANGEIGPPRTHASTKPTIQHRYTVSGTRVFNGQCRIRSTCHFFPAETPNPNRCRTKIARCTNISSNQRCSNCPPRQSQSLDLQALRGLHHPELRFLEGMKRVLNLMVRKETALAREAYRKLRSDCLVIDGGKTGTKVETHIKYFARNKSHLLE